MKDTLLTRARNTWNEYPRQFWVLFFGSLLNAIGGGLVYPFFALYLTGKMKFSMTEVGVIFALFAGLSVLSQGVGGALIDRWGRKPMMVLGMLGEAIGSLTLGFSSLANPDLYWVRWTMVAVLVTMFGLMSSSFGPAAYAMVADMTDGPKRLKGYGLLRVVQNLGIAIGPAIGGFIVNISYFALFCVAAAASLAYVLILALFTRETRPDIHLSKTSPAKAHERSMDFGQLLRDKVFLVFCMLVILSEVVYSQMETTLPVFLNREYGVTEQWYGLLMSTNAGMVVLFQFLVTQQTARYNKAVMMGIGNLFFAVGFGMFGFVSVLPLFFLAQATWTTGEMIAIPVGQAFVADIAPEVMRGRYMGIYGVARSIAVGIGPLLGGAIMDGIGGRYVWYGAILVCLPVAAVFMGLKNVFQRRAEIQSKA